MGNIILKIMFGSFILLALNHTCLADEQNEEIKRAVLGQHLTIRKICDVGPTQSKDIKGCAVQNPNDGVTVTIGNIYQDYAVAYVDQAGFGENYTVYLEKKNGKWVKLDEGTGVSPFDLGIPENVISELGK
ncbi:MAG: hypothetical protein WCD70_06220 [Alphaproteobacteria bacterium]